MKSNSTWDVHRRALTVVTAVLVGAAVGAASALWTPHALSQVLPGGGACDSQACDTKYKVCVDSDVPYKCSESGGECTSTAC